jgi:hypothetical protein
MDDLMNGQSPAFHIYLTYKTELSPLSDREHISEVRARIRTDEQFMLHADEITTLTGENENWVDSLLRAEARRSKRQNEGRLEEIRMEMQAKIAAEKAAEKAELQAMPTFGMF